jgi:hypothetical protein
MRNSSKYSVVMLELLTDQFIICAGTNHVCLYGCTVYVFTTFSVMIITLLLWRFVCKV